jgi:hypothetical protein
MTVISFMYFTPYPPPCYPGFKIDQKGRKSMSTKSLIATGGNQGLGLIQGLSLTITLALVARQLAALPVLKAWYWLFC